MQKPVRMCGKSPKGFFLHDSAEFHFTFELWNREVATASHRSKAAYTGYVKMWVGQNQPWLICYQGVSEAFFNFYHGSCKLERSTVAHGRAQNKSSCRQAQPITKEHMPSPNRDRRFDILMRNGQCPDKKYSTKLPGSVSQTITGAYGVMRVSLTYSGNAFISRPSLLRTNPMIFLKTDESADLLEILVHYVNVVKIETWIKS